MIRLALLSSTLTTWRGSIIAGVLLVASILLPTHVLAQAACPVGCIRFGTPNSACGVRTSADSTFVFNAVSVSWRYRGVFDADAGRVSLETRVGSPNASVNGSVALTDEFTLTGLPPGTPVTFQARLNVSGTNYVSNVSVPNGYVLGQSEIGLRDASSNSASQVFTTSTWAGTIILTIVANPEEPFPLTLFVDGSTSVFGASGGTTAEGLLAFGDLPAGAQITSCGGYFNDTPVPIRKSTWGALKVLYR